MLCVSKATASPGFLGVAAEHLNQACQKKDVGRHLHTTEEPSQVFSGRCVALSSSETKTIKLTQGKTVFILNDLNRILSKAAEIHQSAVSGPPGRVRPPDAPECRNWFFTVSAVFQIFWPGVQRRYCASRCAQTCAFDGISSSVPAHGVQEADEGGHVSQRVAPTRGKRKNPLPPEVF